MMFSENELKVIVPLFTAILAGLFVILGSVVSNKQSMKRLKFEFENNQKIRNKELRRALGEELYQLFSNWTLLVFTMHLPLYDVMKGKISYNDYLDLHNEYSNHAKTDHVRHEMLIEVYFPSLLPSYQETREALSEHNEIIRLHNICYKKNGDGAKFIDPFQKAQEKFENKAEIVKQQLITELRNI